MAEKRGFDISPAMAGLLAKQHKQQIDDWGDQIGPPCASQLRAADVAADCLVCRRASVGDV
ncbi:hypothetical protein [Sphingomonas aerolata]|uniref:hypothetical protein n=1 Tax=Sphingomonas aerolata TaxID=185951 RepID=UPI002FE317CD